MDETYRHRLSGQVHSSTLYPEVSKGLSIPGYGLGCVAALETPIQVRVTHFISQLASHMLSNYV